MKLYDVPRNSNIRILDKKIRVPPAAIMPKKDDVLFFKNIDGMFSYCTNKDGNVCHIAAWTNVEVLH